MNDIALGNETYVAADGIEVAVDIDIVNKDIAMGRRPVASNGVDQGGLAAPTLSDYDNKFAWPEYQ